jgi:hypothetical protein
MQAKRTPAVKEIDVLWITGGLSCDGRHSPTFGAQVS